MRPTTVLILLGSLCLSKPAAAQEDDFMVQEQRKTLQKLVFFGNLHGLGGGLHWAPLSWLGADGMVGIQMPYSMLISAPYAGNRLSLSLRLRGMHASGAYLAAGCFGGWYEAVNKSEDHKSIEYFDVQAPQVALGFAWPPPPTDAQVLVEIGVVSGLPQDVQVETDGYAAFYTITTHRARGLNDDLFPFISFMFQF